ncbi:MAG: dihydroneopterin aldolase [Micavibrio sp.]|nr:dihydroneopterin aldolase [Micavibrio sp.]
MNSLFKTITGGSRQTQVESITPFSSVVANKTSKIFIKDLELNMLIGVLDEEKTSKQRVIVNIEMDVEPNTQWQKDSISDVVSYADVIERVQMIANADHINLVETLVEKIAEATLSFPSVLSARVNVQKPDIISNTQSVGAEIFVEKR